MHGPLGVKAETKLVFGPHLNTRVTGFPKEEEPQFFNIRHHQDVNRDKNDQKISKYQPDDDNEIIFCDI